MTILENLWHGNITPSVRAVEYGSEYDMLAAASNDFEEIFTAELSAEGKRAYAEFCKLADALTDISECDAFSKGFRLGAALMLEILSEEKTQLPPLIDA